MACLGADLPPEWWRDPALMRAEFQAHGTQAEMARAHGVSTQAINRWWKRHGFEALPRGTRAAPPASVSDDWLLVSLKKLGDDATVADIADYADVSPKRVREAAERLNFAGFRVEADDERVKMARVPVPSTDEHAVLFSGDTYRFGVASDVHLNSKHCRLEELHIAYDRFAAEGITDVYNPGDIVAGRGIFRGQDHEILNHTFEDQVDFAVLNYPERPGIATKIISGNHDCEGDFGRAGADACLAVTNRRPDIEWCGRYAADFRLPNEAVLTMRHPMGGSSYAKSYKPQKFAESFEGGTKPNIVLFGHWHNMLYTIERNIFMLNCGTFEGFGGTLGLRVPLGAPAVGFFIVEATLADDGSVVSFRPEWFPFHLNRRAR